MMYQKSFQSPIGTMILQATLEGLTTLRFAASNMPVQVEESTDTLELCCQQLSEYFAGTRMQFDIPLAPQGTGFQQQVWQLLHTIPYGETLTYQALAQSYGDVKAIRAIASANGRNNIAVIIPCHRVVGSNGQLTGFAWGLERKQWLLEHEARVCGRMVQPRLF